MPTEEMKEKREALKRHMKKPTDFHLRPFLDINGEETGFSQTEIAIMIDIIEETGKYDVVGRKW